MKVVFKPEGMERAEEIMEQIRAKKVEISRLCHELDKCFWNIELQIKEQPQEAAAQNEEKVRD